VYISPEVDREVARDPSSVGPVYPESLLVRGIEGSVSMKFIVDTTGRADLASADVISSTNPAFERAVRVALPGMRFVPALLGDRYVRQWVEQDFRFVLMHVDSTKSRSRKRRR